MPGGLDQPSPNCRVSTLSPPHHLPSIFCPLSTAHLYIHLSHVGTYQVPATVSESVFPADDHLPPSLTFFSSPFSRFPSLLIWTYSWERGWWPHSSRSITCFISQARALYAVQSTLQILTHFAFITTLWSRHYFYYSHFTGESVFYSSGRNQVWWWTIRSEPAVICHRRTSLHLPKSGFASWRLGGRNGRFSSSSVFHLSYVWAVSTLLSSYSHLCKNGTRFVRC